jgi:hypothetical protein
VPNDVRLCRAQKWDLLRMSAAALVSTGFFVLSLVFSHQNRVVPAQAAVAGEPPAAVAMPVVAVEMNREVHPAVPARTRHHARATTIGKTWPEPRVERAATLKHVASRGDAHGLAAGVAAMPIRRKVARLITGDGRYSIRPFPSVTTTGS